MKMKNGDENMARMRQTLIRVVTLALIPVILAIAFVAVYRTFTVPPPPRQDAATVALTNRLHTAATMNLHDLQALRRDARQAGYATEEIDVRIWAQSVNHPPVLISVPPPGMDDKWAWTLSADGAYAIATGSKTDAIDRRTVGLYDLKANAWAWTNKFLWPTQHEEPHVFNGMLLLRYVKNNAMFAMEVSPDGKIISIDPLPNSTFTMPSPPHAIPECPGQPVALKHNVFFVTDPSTWHLTGYAHCRLPGLYPAGKGSENTRFSGNGRLKFQIDKDNGAVTVEDSLTQNVLQRLNLWAPATNILVRDATATRDGGTLTLSVGTTAPARELNIAIDVIAEKAKASQNTEAALPKPPQEPHKKMVLVREGYVTAATTNTLVSSAPPCAFSRDDRWMYFYKPDANSLIIAVNTEPAREIARVASLDKVLGLTGGDPIKKLTALEEGRYILLQSESNNFWLLDLSVMRNYASQLDRMAAADYALANPEEKDEEEEIAEDDYFGMWLASYKPAPPIAPIALHAEQLYQHQAWFYAVARFNTCMEYAAMDSRAPRINPLLFARAALLAQQPALAKNICRSAFQALSADRTGYNRMMRYHFQALYFSDER